MFTFHEFYLAYTAKTRTFIKQLKATYKNQYNAIRPIPYRQDKTFCVNEVFVDGGIQEVRTLKGKKNHVVWMTKDSHHSIVQDCCINSTLSVVEGDPGHGKSTLALQLAYDWCEKVEPSPLKDIELFICLRLRQLGGVMSIYEGIKSLLLPRDTVLLTDDIMRILQSCESAVMILEGYDEYNEADLHEDNDITHIINRNMFQQYAVLLTTRSHILPKNMPANSTLIRLTGFDEQAQISYIRKAVVDDNQHAGDNIRRLMQNHPVLSEICEVPLFFVLFAHLTHGGDFKLTDFATVTIFFRYIISCFHKHFLNKEPGLYDNFEINHTALYELALTSLLEDQRQWDKQNIQEKLGSRSYKQYVKIGILVEEEVIKVKNEPGVTDSEHIQVQTVVNFFHQLFCEWYAAHYLVKFMTNNPMESIRPILQQLDPFNYQYVYRFSCGLDPKVAEVIIQYLQMLPDGHKLELLCVLEKEGSLSQIKDRLRELCSKGVTVSKDDSKLLQKSSLQLITIATKVQVSGCFHTKTLRTNNSAEDAFKLYRENYCNTYQTLDCYFFYHRKS